MIFCSSSSLLSAQHNRRHVPLQRPPHPRLSVLPFQAAHPLPHLRVAAVPHPHPPPRHSPRQPLPHPTATLLTHTSNRPSEQVSQPQLPRAIGHADRAVELEVGIMPASAAPAVRMRAPARAHSHVVRLVAAPRLASGSEPARWERTEPDMRPMRRSIGKLRMLVS